MKLLSKHILLILFIISGLFSGLNASDTTQFSEIELFPTMRGNALSIGFFIGAGFNSSSTDNLKSSSFINDRGFNKIPVLGMKDSKSRFPFSEAYKSNYPFNNNLKIAINANYQTNYYIDFGFNLSCNFINEFIYNEDKKLYLNNKKLLEEFTERTIILNEETLLKSGVGISLPLLGIVQGNYRRIDRIVKQNLSLFVGVSFATPLISKTTQYLQIKESEVLRYGNGTDKLTIIDGKELETLNAFRSYFDAVLSWHRSERMTFGVDLYFSYQLNSILEDTNWKQWYLGLKFSFFITPVRLKYEKGHSNSISY